MRISRIAFVLVLFIAAITPGARAQTQVFVPGNASGYFGYPMLNQVVPMVPAITVNGPATITVTYVSGTVNWGQAPDAGPNGVPWNCKCGLFELPLQEARGAAVKKVNNMAALMGVFVPASRVSRSGFNALDGTKAVAQFGIMPGGLFFIGEGKTFAVKEAGTLFLGINDSGVDDNSGGFNVEVSFQQLRPRR